MRGSKRVSTWTATVLPLVMVGGMVGSVVATPGPVAAASGSFDLSLDRAAGQSPQVSIVAAPDAASARATIARLVLGNKGTAEFSGPVRIRVSSDPKIGVSAAGWACGSQVCSADVVLAPGASVAVEFAMTYVSSGVDDSAVELELSLDVADDANPANDSTYLASVVSYPADLSVSLNPTTSPYAGAGGSIGVDVNLSNAGPYTAELGEVYITLPGGFDYQGDDCEVVRHFVTCGFELDAARSKTLSLPLRITDQAAVGAHSVAASVASEHPDLNPSNDTSSTILTVESIDAGVELTAPASAVAGGPTVPVALTATNMGPSALRAGTEIDVDVSLPAHHVMGTVSAPAGWTCTPTSGTGPLLMECATVLASRVSAGARITQIVLPVALAPQALGGASIDARVTVPGDRLAVNDTASLALDAVVTADLAIAFEPGPYSLVAGSDSSVTIPLEIRNDGPSDDPGPVDVYVDRVRGVDLTGDGCALTTRALKCAVGPLAAGQAVTVELDASAPWGAEASDAQTRLRTLVTSQSSDPNPGNDAVSVPLDIIRRADLALEAEVLDADLLLGHDTTLTLTATNLGPVAVSSAVLMGTIAPGLELVGRDPHCIITGRSLACALGALDAGDYSVLDLQVRADSSGEIRQSFAVTGDVVDPNPINNIATVELQVGELDAHAAARTSGTAYIGGPPVHLHMVATSSGTWDVEAGSTVVIEALVPKDVEAMPVAPCYQFDARVQCVVTTGLVRPGETITDLDLPLKVRAGSSPTIREIAVSVELLDDANPDNDVDRASLASRAAGSSRISFTPTRKFKKWAKSKYRLRPRAKFKATYALSSAGLVGERRVVSVQTKKKRRAPWRTVSRIASNRPTGRVTIKGSRSTVAWRLLLAPSATALGAASRAITVRPRR